MKLHATAAALMAATGILGGCADNGGPFVPNDPPPHVQRVEYGVVEHIDLFREGQSAPTGLGVILGGLAGGVIGHQIGGGFGNAAGRCARRQPHRARERARPVSRDRAPE